MRTVLLATLAGAAVFSAGAWMRIDTPLTLQPESRIWVEGTSTTKSWSCKAPAVDANVVAINAEAPAAIVNGEKAVRSVTVRVAAPRLDCGNGTMTKHALKALKADDHKTITFALASYDLAKALEGTKGTLKGTLTLAGVAKPVAIVATAKPAPAGQVRITGSYALKMTEYGMKPPNLMLGAMKVGDEVTIGFDLLLKAAPPAAPTP
ncbi:MAG: YceI family protein [Gemmatimonadaceae bacterium]|nr:YceI family protein [Gemmatimonadaceae bacterium]